VRHRSAAVIASVIAVVVASVATGIVPSGAQSSSQKPQAVETGVSASEVHIAVVADVDNPLAPGLFKGTVDGVKAGAAYVNTKAGGGGVAGRKLVVDFYDSHLSPNESRNAAINACQNDYAMVGTMVLFLTNVSDIVGCTDKAGQATGLPDLAATTIGIPEACSPVSFPAIGGSVDCSTVTQPQQTYYGNQGEAKWLLSKQKGLHGPMLVSNDTKDANRGGTILALTDQKAGIKADQGTTVTKSGRDPQSAYTQVVKQMQTDGSNYSLSTLAVQSTLELRSEAAIQGLDSSKVIWDSVSAYGNKLVTDNAQAFEGEYQALQTLPFEEAKVNKTLAAFVKYVKQVGGTPDQFSAYAFEAVLAFQDAVAAVVQKHGVNGLTRANLIEGIKTLTDFDAGGMAGTHSFKTGRITNCFVEVQFKSGKWVRLYPKKKGTFDCKASNGISFQANLLNGG
jgi:DNA-binding ferritin-like protein (Dps family)